MLKKVFISKIYKYILMTGKMSNRRNNRKDVLDAAIISASRSSNAGSRVPAGHDAEERKFKKLVRKAELAGAAVLIAGAAAAYFSLSSSKNPEISSKTPPAAVTTTTPAAATTPGINTCAVKTVGETVIDLTLPLSRPWTVIEDLKYHNITSPLPVQVAYAYNGTSFIWYEQSGAKLEDEKVGKYPLGGKFNVPVLSTTPLNFIGIFDQALSPAQIKAYGKETVAKMIEEKQPDLGYKWPDTLPVKTAQECKSMLNAIPYIKVYRSPTAPQNLNKIEFSIQKTPLQGN